MPDREQKTVLVIGAGPVGALTALSLHKRGFRVEVWEGRTDPRKESVHPSNLRSINLAISARGVTALRSVDPTLANEMLNEAIPMRGRMIHHVDGDRREAQAYDPEQGQCINSVPRPLLNLRLVERLPAGIALHFSTKLASIDWAERTAYAKPSKSDRNAGESVQPNEDEKDNESIHNQAASGKICKFDLIIGCDGSWSKVRREMMRVERVDLKQHFIDHDYVELHMPPRSEADERAQGQQVGEDDFLMEKHYLHIWPREKFMLIALPNKNGSFTLTLFCPRNTLRELQTRQQARAFFQQHFPDALIWAGEDRLLSDFAKNPRGALVTINVKPSHHFSAVSSATVLLLGDASHSMVPFYGQGLNCGLEDVRVFNSLLDKYNVSSDRMGENRDACLEKALEEYSDIRNGDLEAIVTLAMDNYAEMRSKVVSPTYQLRRALDSFLSWVSPPTSQRAIDNTHEPFPTARVNGWSSLYSMVTFRPDVSYKEALRKENKQREILERLVWIVGGTGALSIVGGVAWASQIWMRRR